VGLHVKGELLGKKPGVAWASAGSCGSVFANGGKPQLVDELGSATSEEDCASLAIGEGATTRQTRRGVAGLRGSLSGRDQDGFVFGRASALLPQLSMF